jgi:transcriptional regulator with XRE-family HTH domain
MMMASGNPRNYAGDAISPMSQTARMVKVSSKPSMNHLRAWREFNRMSQEELGKKVGTAGNVIGLLESGERGLSDKWLRKLAPALGTTPGFLLDHDPDDIDRDLLEAVRDIAATDKQRVLQILQTFKKVG